MAYVLGDHTSMKNEIDAVASEQSIFNKNHNYNIQKCFPCCGEHVRTYISGSRCTWWQKSTNRHIHTHMRDNHNNDNNKDYLKC